MQDRNDLELLGRDPANGCEEAFPTFRTGRSSWSGRTAPVRLANAAITLLAGRLAQVFRTRINH